MRIIIITGPPYSGKGTQCKALIKELNLAHLSTGEHIRKEKENKTDLGILMSEYSKKGQLVPDKMMKDFLDTLIQQYKNEEGFILDGYPRTIPQVNDLIEVLKSHELTISEVINIEVPEKELLKRAKERAETSDREDDKNPETHYKRIRLFQEFTIPAIEFLKEKYDVLSFDGTGKIERITKKILARL
ncbi:MAG: nucleoside monophosphate kinase [Bacteroidota bacterium]